ncbi:MAG: DUF6293 family protein [Candidatus Nezhaarchaeota archaeon]|nr:DUF6293 family protein [Candidatus Nezhaarchaeota archaeon]MCX8141190.1 DUF6293 family protein [Candidatus Nezhaarchaeota archaeon]MDW8049456.1 DUF6293 family protein [Nitrososphaerota archaeon]
MATFICFVGHDFMRIVDGINYWRSKEVIDDIYLVQDKKKDKYGYASRLNVKELRSVLTFAGKEPYVISVNPQSYEDVFAVIYSVVRKEVEDLNRSVYIDATSTTKEAYGAVVTVALMFQGVKLYVVPPAERGWYVPDVESPEFQSWFSKVRSVRGLQPQEIFLPGFRLEKLSYEEEKALMVLERMGCGADSIKTLIKWCGEDPNDSRVKNKFSRLVNKLVSKGLLTEETGARAKAISLTDFGKVYAKALKYHYEQKRKEETAPYPAI